jgi:flagellar basal-body rod modification protein FlgD
MSTSVNSTSSSSSANQSTSTTNSATQGMDQNAFLQILSAELANQDPQSSQDDTEFVSQMAQFSTLEQMANLNTTMRLIGANSLIGKQVTTDKTDANGNLYSGQVQDVVRNGDDIQVNVIVGTQKDSSGNVVNNTQQFELDDVTQIGNATASNASTTSTSSTSGS